ncbi:MAG TPA: L-aspartate oxidase [Steroidobacteraceae bacterium]
MAPRGLQVLETDVLVVGAGAAGLCTAMAVAPRRALVLSAGKPETSTCTALAQGGIAAPIGPGDSVAAHVADTLLAACHSSVDHVAANVIARAVDAVEFLETAGVVFDHRGSRPALHLEAGHSRPRVLHAEGDRTGRAILNALVARARECEHIAFQTGQAASLLEASDGSIAGAFALDAEARPLAITARETVLATGGLGRLFEYTTNETYAAGDGLAMALARGALAAGLEFVQFHPTALLSEQDPLPLLTEALRGAGATLFTGSGRRLMLDRHPRGDLAPRDVIARAVWECRESGDEVFLDGRAVFCSARGSEFPAALATCRAHGVDPHEQLIPVTAAAHYHMGGLVVDEYGRTNLEGLWACGEVAYTGLHGANRLASNSLLEAIVCGRSVGAQIRRSESVRRPWISASVPQCAPFDEGCEAWTRLRRLMWKHMGPVRDGPDLVSAIRAIRAIRRSLAADSLILRQRFNLAAAMLNAAAAREESRGAHWRRDFPQRDPTRDGIGALRSIRQRSRGSRRRRANLNGWLSILPPS